MTDPEDMTTAQLRSFVAMCDDIYEADGVLPEDVFLTLQDVEAELLKRTD